MKHIKPITELRNTTEISDLAHQINEPIFITKNGYGDLVLMSHELYCRLYQETPLSLFQDKYVREIKHERQSDIYGFIKVASATPKVIVGDVTNNVLTIIDMIKTFHKNGVKVAVFPELALTSYSCRDLFFSSTIHSAVKQNIQVLLEATRDVDMVTIVGAPLTHESKLYNCAIVITQGKILGVVPKMTLPNYDEFHESRHFFKAEKANTYIDINGTKYPFGTKLIFECANYLPLKIALEICEDLWAPNPPSTAHALAGASLIANLSASPELVGKNEYREMLVKATSARLLVGYIYASAGPDESTTDVCFGGDNLIAENGVILKRSKLFTNGYIITEIDFEKIANDRRRNTTFASQGRDEYWVIPFNLKLINAELTRHLPTNPFLPHEERRGEKLNEIITIQAMGLKKRLEYVKAENLVLGLSGGLDSTLALIIAYEACQKSKIEPHHIHCLTMPCFGTSTRTRNNAIRLAQCFGVTLKEIDITEAVKLHFNNIGHDGQKEDATYENSQARERTQILMDYANKVNGFVIGTGDLSELALGWTTYNGDHMSMYGVNASIPKTIIRELVTYYANENIKLKNILDDIVDTPISPELKSLKDGEIYQATEEIIGPYELHDFFIYHFLRHNVSVRKLLFLTMHAFKGKYGKDEVKKWLKVFIIRFFSQQFKRNCLPDGIKVGSVSLSPRDDFKMVSDMSSQDFLLELEKCE